LEPDEPNGDGIGGVVIFPGEFGSIDAEPEEPVGEESPGGLSPSENGDGGVTVTGLRSGSINAGGLGVADAGGISQGERDCFQILRIKESAERTSM